MTTPCATIHRALLSSFQEEEATAFFCVLRCDRLGPTCSPKAHFTWGADCYPVTGSWFQSPLNATSRDQRAVSPSTGSPKCASLCGAPIRHRSIAKQEPMRRLAIHCVDELFDDAGCVFCPRPRPKEPEVDWFSFGESLTRLIPHKANTSLCADGCSTSTRSTIAESEGVDLSSRSSSKLVAEQCIWWCGALYGGIYCVWNDHSWALPCRWWLVPKIYDLWEA